MTTPRPPVSRLERVLRAGLFAVTAELDPPDSADPQEVYDKALVLSQVCDAINATDASGAHCHMSSVAICALLTRAGYEPVYQVSCRDRNRIAIQGDLLGAAALGVRNVLCLTGDDTSVGDQPEAKRVFDLDSIHLLQTARIMRDEGVFLSGRKLTVPPPLFLGAASNPFAMPYGGARSLAKKAPPAPVHPDAVLLRRAALRQFMTEVRDLGLNNHVYILVGVGPLRPKAAEYMRTRVPGVRIPDAIMDRLRKTPRAGSVKKASASASRSSSRCAKSTASAASTSWPTVRKSW